MAVKRWLWIVGGIFATLIFCCVALVGAGIYMFSRHVDAKQVTQAQADSEFAAVRGRFKDQEPLLEIKKDKVYAARLEERAGTYNGPLPTQLNVLAYDRGEHKRVHLSIPLWLLHMKGKMKLQGEDMGVERLDLSVDDIERAGPALLIDHTDGHARLLVWTN
jgi:hypothetical protein